MVTVSITIPNDKVAEFKEGFLKIYPKKAGYSDAQWFKKKLRDWAFRVYRNGKKQIWEESNAAVVDDSTVDEVLPDE